MSLTSILVFKKKKKKNRRFFSLVYPKHHTRTSNSVRRGITFFWCASTLVVRPRTRSHSGRSPVPLSLNVRKSLVSKKGKTRGLKSTVCV